MNTIHISLGKICDLMVELPFDERMEVLGKFIELEYKCGKKRKVIADNERIARGFLGILQARVDELKERH